MIRGLLVGLDRSPYSKAAVGLGLRWAKQFDALLAGLAVVDEPSIDAPEPVPLGGGAFVAMMEASRAKVAQKEADRRSEEFCLRCTEAGVAAKPLEAIGPAEQLIVAYAQRFDLILLGRETHFRYGSEQRPDDVLHRVIKQAPRPIVVAPLEEPGDGPVIVAYDGSLQAMRALHAFVQSGLATGAPVEVVTVIKDSTAGAKVADQAVEYLESHQFDARRVAAPSRGSVHATLVETAAERNAQLMVLGAYGKTIIKEMFLGSTTNHAIDETKTPLFLYH